MMVKICGITRQEDALAAAEAGANAIGFIFVKSSRRWIESERARSIIESLPAHVTPVGVFVNASRHDIRNVVAATGVRLLQLHGDESPADTLGFSVRVWKGFRIKDDFEPRSLSNYSVDGYVLDSYVEGVPGGTGTTFDWDLAVAAKKYGRIILSGGITPDNVQAAITKVQPFAIDVSSGVESSPGVKDAAKIARLFDAIRTIKERSC